MKKRTNIGPTPAEELEKNAHELKQQTHRTHRKANELHKEIDKLHAIGQPRRKRQK